MDQPIPLQSEEQLSKLKGVVTAELERLNVETTGGDVLLDYILAMVRNRKSCNEMKDALAVFLLAATDPFINWLYKWVTAPLPSVAPPTKPAPTTKPTQRQPAAKLSSQSEKSEKQTGKTEKSGRTESSRSEKQPERLGRTDRSKSGRSEKYEKQPEKTERRESSRSERHERQETVTKTEKSVTASSLERKPSVPTPRGSVSQPMTGGASRLLFKAVTDSVSTIKRRSSDTVSEPAAPTDDLRKRLRRGEETNTRRSPPPAERQRKRTPSPDPPPRRTNANIRDAPAVGRRNEPIINLRDEPNTEGGRLNGRVGPIGRGSLAQRALSDAIGGGVGPKRGDIRDRLGARSPIPAGRGANRDLRDRLSRSPARSAVNLDGGAKDEPIRRDERRKVPDREIESDGESVEKGETRFVVTMGSEDEEEEDRRRVEREPDEFSDYDSPERTPEPPRSPTPQRSASPKRRRNPSKDEEDERTFEKEREAKRTRDTSPPLKSKSEKEGGSSDKETEKKESVWSRMGGRAEKTQEGGSKQEPCSYHPNCKDPKCRYLHVDPNGPDVCRLFPQCPHGDSCAKTHLRPSCRFGPECTRPVCEYNHSVPSVGALKRLREMAMAAKAAREKAGAKAGSAPAASKPPAGSPPCQYGILCSLRDCTNSHPPGRKTPF
eukprot:comp18166_c0_seq1/m.18963 comp18166_c0_seq1/g.18963  ORF comp18166_c0_seq1/g.18963 comp18166_c0_seq1/m.18963 type:complete len:662 (-) comp18166_c0_seq1:185-2170(-)